MKKKAVLRPVVNFFFMFFRRKLNQDEATKTEATGQTKKN